MAVADGSGAQLWDRVTRRPLGRLEISRPEEVARLAFAGDRLLAVDGKGAVEILEPPGRSRGPFTRAVNAWGTGVGAHAGSVSVAAESPLVAVVQRGQISIWDAARPEHLLDLPAPVLPNGVRLSPDGRTLAILGPDSGNTGILLVPLRPPDGAVGASEDLARRLQVATRRLQGTAIVDTPAPLPAWHASGRAEALPRWPVNPGFEEGEPGETPPGWTALGPRYAAAAVADRPFAGARCAVVEKLGDAKSTSSGQLMQTIDAAHLRGKTIRLSAAIRVEPKDSGHGALWLRVDRPSQRAGFFYDMLDAPITSPKWQRYEIKGRVATDAVEIAFGLLLVGAGKAFIDDVSIDIVQ